MLGEGLKNLLVANAGVAAILVTRPESPHITSGIFPLSLPEAEPLPAIVYAEVHGDGVMTMDGPDALQFSRMQFSCYGSSYSDSKRLARAVRKALESFTGTLSDGTVIGSMKRVGEVDAFEEAPFIYQTPVDIEITYQDLST